MSCPQVNPAVSHQLPRRLQHYGGWHADRRLTLCWCSQVARGRMSDTEPRCSYVTAPWRQHNTWIILFYVYKKPVVVEFSIWNTSIKQPRKSLCFLEKQSCSSFCVHKTTSRYSIVSTLSLTMNHHGSGLHVTLFVNDPVPLSHPSTSWNVYVTHTPNKNKPEEVN